MQESDEIDETAKLIPQNTDSKHNFGMEVEKVVVKWENISFTVTEDEKSTQILNDLSGFANPGELLAIMGGSGSGKTSFLSVLSNHIVMQDNFDISGNVKLNEKNIHEIESNVFVRFVPQELALFEFLSPYEFLKFNLSLRTEYSEEELDRRVNESLELLGLKKVAHSLIGGLIVRGLSGGEKKRVAIANELMMCPAVVILDEPTSGLDSVIANYLIEILKGISKYGVTIIFTIHQPSRSMFQAFDRLILMQEGHFVYQGTAEGSVEHFKSIGFQVPKQVNPPDYYMKILRIDNRNCLTYSEEKSMQILRDGYKASEKSLWEGVSPATNGELNPPEFIVTPSFTKSIKKLFWREKLNYKRNPMTIRFKISYAIVISIIIIILFYDIGYDEEAMDTRKGAVTMILLNCVFAPAFAVSMNLALERPLVFKEIKSDLYGVGSYLLMKILFEIPIMLVTGVISVFSVYYLINLNDHDFGKPLILMILSFCSYMQGLGLGIIAGTLSKNTIIANMMVAVINTSLVIFSGFFNDPEAGPEAFTWLRFCTPYFFLRNAGLKNEFDDLDYDDDVDPEPEDRYNYDGEIAENIAISFIHYGVMFLLAYIVYKYAIYKISLGYK